MVVDRRRLPWQWAPRLFLFATSMASFARRDRGGICFVGATEGGGEGGGSAAAAYDDY